MSPVNSVRVAGVVLLLGITGFITYMYLEIRALSKQLNGSKSWYNEGEGYLIDDAESLHFDDLYYFVIDPWLVLVLVILVVIALFCLIAPAKVISIFRR